MFDTSRRIYPHTLVDCEAVEVDQSNVNNENDVVMQRFG